MINKLKSDGSVMEAEDYYLDLKVYFKFWLL